MTDPRSPQPLPDQPGAYPPPPPFQPAPGYVAYPVYHRPPGNGFGVASFSCAMVGTVMSLVPIVNFIDWLLVPLAVVFGIVGLFQAGRPKGLAIAGLVLGLIGIAVMVIGGLLLIALLGAGAAGGH